MIRTKRGLKIAIALSVFVFFSTDAYAETTFPFKFGFSVEPASTPQEVSSSIQLLLILTVLSLAPAIIIMMTSFTRITIVLSFLRNALGTQQMPPNQVLIGLALFLSLFIMTPVINDINTQAYEPFNRGEITQEQALDNSSRAIKGFMLKQFGDNEKELAFFVSLAKIETPVRDPMDLPLTVVIPAFIINELTIAFKIGFLIYIPFLIIDMVVASTLMSMGMMMLPPIMISLPFKILLFIMVDGWNLITRTLVSSFIT
ncbi:MAG: flagellar type III secretion system pore protein FliP [Clostridiaceae bacterium]|jgi:flagellar biosynthetic protein FliP|nr:flagellar type III secretion system pore protein FliP [Clostridiaceae bacterium]